VAKKYLITGGCGFLGANLAAEVLRRGDELYVFDNLSRAGSYENLRWLQSLGRVHHFHADIRNAFDVAKAMRISRPDVVFHLAGQVAMTTSIDNPRLDFEVNVMGSLNVLEAVREFCPDAVVSYSSTNKVYGDLEYLEFKETPTRYEIVGFEGGLNENVKLDFRSPYGCSKGAADQYMLDYARIFGLNTIVFRHSSIFGGRQFSTSDQGWIGWFVSRALEAAENPNSHFTIAGDGKQVRDVLFASDLVTCYFKALEVAPTLRGQAFNIGGGMSNSLSLIELFAFLERELVVQLSYEKRPWRESDQKVFVADTTKARELFGWEPTVLRDDALRHMIGWVKANG
jgi:CDP-paratose 2-epimerase